MRKRRKVERYEDTHTKVLCGDCSQWFMLPNQCMECGNWNQCIPCMRKESEETMKRLRARGITLPDTPWVIVGRTNVP